MSNSRNPIPAMPDASDGVGEKPGFRTKSIGTRVTPEELREIEAAAEHKGRSSPSGSAIPS